MWFGSDSHVTSPALSTMMNLYSTTVLGAMLTATFHSGLLVVYCEAPRATAEAVFQLPKAEMSPELIGPARQSGRLDASGRVAWMTQRKDDWTMRRRRGEGVEREGREGRKGKGGEKEDARGEGGGKSERRWRECLLTS